MAATYHASCFFDGPALRYRCACLHWSIGPLLLKPLARWSLRSLPLGRLVHLSPFLIRMPKAPLIARILGSSSPGIYCCKAPQYDDEHS